MNKKYENYINHIVSDLEIPYFFNMENQYGLRPDEYELVLSKVIDEPISVEGNNILNKHGKVIYYEIGDGSWVRYEYDNQGNQIYFENSNGFWFKKEYDNQGNLIYHENNNGVRLDFRNVRNKYIDYIVSEIEAPYFKEMEEVYKVRPEEYELVLSRVFNQPVTIKGNYVYDKEGNVIYSEDRR